MTDKPDWLPELVPTDGNWDTVLKNLYQVFKRDFVEQDNKFRGLQIDWHRRVKDPPYEEGFWHLITRDDKKSGDRYPDFPRAQKISWIMPIIQNERDAEVRTWEYLEHGKFIRTYLWLENWDFVVILERRKERKREAFHLITAFHLDGPSRRKTLRRKYMARVR